MSDPTEREHRLAAAVGGALAGCPAAEDLDRFLDGSLEGAPRGAIAEHVDGCAPCRAALEALAAAVADEAEAALPEAVERRSEETIAALRESRPEASAGWLQPALRAAAAITFAAALGVAAWVWWPGRLDTELGELRGGETMELLEPVGTVAEPPEVLRWAAAEGAESYAVVLLDAEMRSLWQGRVYGGDRTSLELDAEARALLEPGRRYTFQVVAMDSLGFTLGPAGSAHFSIEAGEPAD